MKAISLKQPWADMILKGMKSIETRKWKTPHRGDILICSSKNVDDPQYKDRVLGHALCVVNLFEIKVMKHDHEENACCKLYFGAYAWFLKDLRRIKPFPMKGALGVFDIEDKEIVYL